MRASISCNYLCNVWMEFDENFTPGVKSPVHPKYDVRLDLRDRTPRHSFSMLEREIHDKAVLNPELIQIFFTFIFGQAPEN